jgi:outer membrane protein OmpA-like peptidoglycan-associated protein
MKKNILILLFILLGTISAFSQKTYYPLVESQGEPKVKILVVDIAKDYTVVSFVYTGSVPKLPFGVVPDTNSNWCQIDPRIQIIGVGGKRKYKFIKAEGIPVAPKRLYIKQDKQKVYFKVYFEKIEPGVERVDIFECTNYDNIICFNFYGVLIRNPEPPKQPDPTPPQPDPQKPTPTKPVVTVPLVTVTGKVLDAKTQKPLSANLIFDILPSQKQVTTIVSTATGEYKTTLSPASFYSVSASAKGYLVTEENIDLTKAVDKQVITKNILLKPIEIGETIRLNNIYFPQGEATLLSASFAELDQLNKILQQNPTMEILIEGHTDIIGNPNDNMKLSEDRVRAVKDYLVKKGAVATRIQTKAYGGTKPIKTEGTDEERQINRRVEFKILKK